MPPRATYRLQFNAGFRLADAIALVPYLSALGISHVYASPLLQACPGSAHGYDVCDFNVLNPELGTEAELAQLVAELRRHGMGLVLDIVPNHMGVGTEENQWWWDVLTHGQNSRFARHFDIYWPDAGTTADARVVLPVLGEDYERVLERCELRCEYCDGKFTLNYFDRAFPLAPDSILRVLKRADQLYNVEVQREATNAAPARTRGRKGIPAQDERSLRSRSRSVSASGFADPRSAAARGIAAALRELNDDQNALHDLIQQQRYRLVGWRRGDSEINYRRFFSVSTLAAVRVEDKKVFADAHALLKRWIDLGLVDGLRVDHIDGLADPEQYLARLRALAPRAWIVTEKILGPDEMLPAGWPVVGTSGYDFTNLVNGLFVSPAGELPLTRFYSDFTGESTDPKEVMRQGKRRVLRELFASEIGRLADMLTQIAARHPRCAGAGRDGLASALMELIACFPVYRTYVQPGQKFISEADFANIREAVSSAQHGRPELTGPFGLLNELLLLQLDGRLEQEFIVRFQQLTGAVMAKGVEDTAFYCFNRLVALNEVGGDPRRFGVSPEDFHERCLFRQAQMPDAMLGTSTHDTKRSEDVRARLNLLSEIPDRWAQAVTRWAAMNEKFRRNGCPDRNAEYLFYQNLFGAWPISGERALAYMEKAAREAKQHTSWTDRNREYEEALRNFVSGAMTNSGFTHDLDQFVSSLVKAGRINSLATTLLKLTAPGVPDIYQGAELWDLSLVDPDNRRPVDFELRRRLIEELGRLSVDETWSLRGEGLPKLSVIRQALGLRAVRPEVFSSSSYYQPLHARGIKAEHVIAFIRGGASVTIVPRLVLGVADGWGDTSIDLPPGRWRNLLTGDEFAGDRFQMVDILRRFPVALLIR